MSERVAEPPEGTERDLLVGWLEFHRSALAASCAGLTDDQLARRSVPPSALSLLGLLRHLAEMERVYGVWGNCCSGRLTQVWGVYADGGPEHDFECDASQVAVSMRAWRDEKASTDGAIRDLGLDEVGGGNGRTLRWNLHKLVGEYARHNGHADLLREAIDGAVGE